VNGAAGVLPHRSARMVSSRIAHLLSAPMPFRRLTHHHRRLTIAIVLGLALALTLPMPMTGITRLLVGWNVMVWCYLCMMGWLIARTGHSRVRAIADEEVQSGASVLAIMSIAAIVSLAAIFLELASVKDLAPGERMSRYALTGATTLGSWCLVATMYTFYYARLFYRADAGHRPIAFPEDEQHPDYWDFLYFSVTIAVTAQTSDVVIRSGPMRKAVMAQSILSFLFNVAILGLLVNIAAGLVGSS
jgi:uncharacterized membrane protein